VHQRLTWESHVCNDCGSTIAEGAKIYGSPAGRFCSAHCAKRANERALHGESEEMAKKKFNIRPKPPDLTAEEERAGYVPNVVYSCGGMIHNDTLIVLYAMSDMSSGFATAPLPVLLAVLQEDS
jgi:hypothetical protein